MTEVHIQQDGITIAGHARYAPQGQDIVCAAVSILTQVLIKSIEDLTADKIKYQISPGRVDIYHKNLSEQGRLLVDSFFIGICMIANEHPNYVRII